MMIEGDENVWSDPLPWWGGGRIRADGDSAMNSKGQLLRPNYTSKPPYVKFSHTIAGKRYEQLAHILCAKVWDSLEPPFPGAAVMHENDDYSYHGRGHVRWERYPGENNQTIDRTKRNRDLVPHHESIIQRVIGGETLAKLAVEYGVRKSTIDHVLNRSSVSKRMRADGTLNRPKRIMKLKS